MTDASGIPFDPTKQGRFAPAAGGSAAAGDEQVAAAVLWEAPGRRLEDQR